MATALKKNSLRIIKIIYLLLLIIHGIALYWGSATVISAFLFYSFAFIVIEKIILYFNTSWVKSNWRLTYWTMFGLTLLVELTLRGLRFNASYMERNGSFLYTSPFNQIRLNNTILPLYRGDKDVGLYLMPASTKGTHQNFEFTNEYIINSWGFRDRDYSTRQLDTSYTVLALGDSFTMGVGAHQDSTWARQLEAILRQKNSSVLCVNGAIAGSDIFYEFYKLENLLYKTFKPQKVILAINSSDIHDIVIRGGMERFVSKVEVRYRACPWWEYFYAWSYISRYVTHQVFNIQWHYFTTKQYELEKAHAFKLMQECILERYIPFMQKNNLSFDIVFSPMLNELELGKLDLQPLIESLEKKGVRVINLYNAFKEQPHYENLFWKLDLHNNSAGYGVWAKEIAKYF